MSLNRFKVPPKGMVTKESKARKEQIHNLALSFSLPFNNYEDTDRESCFNPLIFKTINFMIVGYEKEFIIDNELDRAANNFSKSSKFVKSKIQGFCSSKDYKGLIEYIRKVCNNQLSGLEDKTANLYLRTMFCLFSYFDFGKYMIKKDLNLNDKPFYDLYEYCFVVTLNRELDFIGYKENKDGYLINGLNNTAEMLRNNLDFKYQSKYIKDFVSPERREEYVTLLNTFFDTWKTEDKFAVRNRVEGLNLESLTLDWSYLFEKNDKLYDSKVFKALPMNNESLRDFVCQKFTITETEKKDTSPKYLDDLGMHYIYNTFCDISVFSLYCNTSLWTLISYALIGNYQSDYEEKVRDKENKQDNEIATLKADNKNLKRSVGKFEKDLQDAQKEVDRVKKELAEKQESVIDSAEYESLRGEIEKKDKELSEVKEDSKRVENKVAWYEEKVKELESKLKYYSEIESDLMSLQNENNTLLSQINEFEVIEEDTEEEYNKKLNMVKDKHIVFIGGTGGMLQKYTKIFKNSEYIDITEQGTSFTIAPSVDYVVVYTKMVTHAHCERAARCVGKDKMISLNICNIRMVVNELYRLLPKE